VHPRYRLCAGYKNPAVVSPATFTAIYREAYGDDMNVERDDSGSIVTISIGKNVDKVIQWDASQAICAVVKGAYDSAASPQELP
jgi:hypothetical protein